VEAAMRAWRGAKELDARGPIQKSTYTSSIEIAGQPTLVELKRRISSASWRRPKMNTWGYRIVEEVDHENVS